MEVVEGRGGREARAADVGFVGQDLGRGGVDVVGGEPFEDDFAGCYVHFLEHALGEPALARGDVEVG